LGLKELWGFWCPPMLSSIALEKVKDEAHKARINSGTFN
jgi:hypothetical protein